MSNVLIGIIGVILFIGLALAGALFLGPRFQEASTNSKAAAQIQTMHQIVNAAAMYATLQNGTVPDGSSIGAPGNTALVDNGYLKSMPKDPTGLGATYVPTTRASGRYLLIGIQTQAVCEAINRQTVGASYATPEAIDPALAQGCYDETANYYTVYMRMSS